MNKTVGALNPKMGLHQIPLAVQAVPGPIFLIPEKLQEKYRYPALTKNLNAAKLFKLDVDAKRKALPKDYLTHIKMVYLEEGASPSHHAYGWVTT